MHIKHKTQISRTSFAFGLLLLLLFLSIPAGNNEPHAPVPPGNSLFQIRRRLVVLKNEIKRNETEWSDTAQTKSEWNETNYVSFPKKACRVLGKPLREENKNWIGNWYIDWLINWFYKAHIKEKLLMETTP